MKVLAADIGGTKTWLQLASVGHDGAHGGIKVALEQRYDSTAYASFDAMLREFLAQAASQGVEHIAAACFAVAGPVETLTDNQQRARVTNLPWTLDARQLARSLAIEHVSIINDFQAVGYGLDLLGSEQLLTLQQGQTLLHGPRALLGAGTGLGQGLLVWQAAGNAAGAKGSYTVLPTEAGHADFAPADGLQRDLLEYLAARQPRVTVEDVLSGRGLVNGYRFLCAKYPQEMDPALQRAMEQGDAAAAISAAGLAAADTLAGRALDLFVSIYGSQAGNLALACLPYGGIYITGGIAPKIRARMEGEVFLQAFVNKAPMRELLQKIPVYLVLDAQVGLKGAVLVASRR